MGVNRTKAAQQNALDQLRMAEIAAFTAKTLTTKRPVPFGASIVHSVTGKTLLRAVNRVGPEFDPSCHAEVRAIRLTTKKLKSLSLKEYTLYTTCEPCPMCMSAALWARVGRVVYGATIAQCNRHCLQIQIPANEVSQRSDMPVPVVGPVQQELCYALFTHPNMLKAFREWSSSKRKRS